MHLYTTDPDRAGRFKCGNEERILDECAELLKLPGSVLLVPTETVYGLVCGWNDEKGRDRIYELKQRSGSKALALFADSAEMLEQQGMEIPDAAKKLVAAFCPGPLTIVVRYRDNSTLGFRIPDHPFVLKLLKRAGHPLASTSANLSGRPNALTVEDALSELVGAPEIAVDGGDLQPGAMASTVVELSGDGLKILREGTVKLDDMRKILH